jgi:hypothetical protein
MATTRTSEPQICTTDIVSDYEILDGGSAIRFKPCGIVSHNQSDVRHYYCSRCKRFMNDPKLISARLGQRYANRT